MSDSQLGILTLFCVIAIAGSVAGMRMSTIPNISRRIVTLSGGVLLVISLLLVLPELAVTFGWTAGSALMLAGVLLIWAIDKFVYPVCPACSHTHDHDGCSTRLHGFATPLITAAMFHSLFDGWMMLSGEEALAAGMLLHKLPESIAYGVILRAALRSGRIALLWAVAAQASTIAGAFLAFRLTPSLGMVFMSILLALGGGMFLYLGAHTMHGEWRRRYAVRSTTS